MFAESEPVTAADSREPARLDRGFQAAGPNQKWSPDFTYIWAAEGWLSAAAIL